MLLRYLRISLVIVIVGALLSGCVAVYPVTSTFRARNHVRGVVVDQNGAPVVRAKLVFDEWEHVPFIPIPFTPDVRFSRTRKARTDETGAFRIAFKRRGLSLKTIKKSGYVFEPCVTPKSWSRSYDAEGGMARHSARFVMYDIANADTSATVIASSPLLPFVTDGRDYYLSFASGKITTNHTIDADLVFRVGQVGEKNWLMTIRAVDGGVWVSKNEMPYAPADGYVAGFSSLYGQGYAIPYRVQYEFFAKTQGGKHYARVIADLIKKKQTIQFHYVVNREGDRFLFVPERIEKMGVHGPPYCNERYHCRLSYVIAGEGVPWWRKQEHYIYPMLSARTFESMVNPPDGDQASCRYVARQLYAPASVLDAISRSTIWQERRDVAANPACPVDILKRLAEDEEESVRRQATETLGQALNAMPFMSNVDSHFE
jgi:hypothetical protein